MYDYISNIITLTLEGIYDAHTDDIFILETPNAYPLVVKDSWEFYSNSYRVFYPNTCKFYKTSETKKYADIVTAVVTGDDFTYDLSSFLYNACWSDTPPSLYELLLISLVINKRYVSHETLSKCILTVLTSDVEEFSIELMSEFARKPFRGWENCDLKID
jgi:hypothetical protein